MKSEYEDYMIRFGHLTADPRSRVNSHPGEFYMSPFRMFGNLYYAGDKFVCVHLLDTGDGLLLFDSSNAGQGGLLINAIWELGFKPADVKWIIHSHGHVDHIGQAQFFKDMFGTQLFLSEPDAAMFRERPELSYIHCSSSQYDALFEPDVIIRDGDVIQFGNTTIRFVLTPGHTEGVLSCFFDITDGVEMLRAGFFGGFGFNTLTSEFLQEIGDTDFSMRKKFMDSLEKVRDEHVDVMMGNHPINNNLFEKVKFLNENPGGRNPFVDKEEWRRYLLQKHNELENFIAAGR